MRPCTTCGQPIPDKAELCRECGAVLPPLTLAEKLVKKHLKHLQHSDPAPDGAVAAVQHLALADHERTPLPKMIGNPIWYVHPKYDACFYLGGVVSISGDGQMMCVEDKWKNTSFTYIDGPWIHIGHSCDCAENA
jgi:hypothetical protein